VQPSGCRRLHADVMCLCWRLLALECYMSWNRLQAELERILEENQKKLDEAKAKQSEAGSEGPVVAAKMQNLTIARVGHKDTLVSDDVFVLGK
jgi:hypothetical protein